ncbi:unnamed protein product [Spirodela intermedia]|uniref:Uncharacterized protein n=1 Tax=Spirodela intermedia TaxID=51605 RepID=A0A7I8IW27_SPIIN|nr:unnamed protein product [Spirodela intermedia]CAA6661863.1 unnamed protein product [Spirodela intermedia]
MWRSRERACRTVRMPMEVLRRMEVDQRGRILSTALRSSTWSTVHRLHGFATLPSGLTSPSLFVAARFKNLSSPRHLL